MAAPVLDLATIVERPTVVIDGIPYALRSVEQFSIVEYAQHLPQSGRLNTLLGKPGDGMTDAEAAELQTLLHVYAARVLEAPPAVIATLSDVQRLGVAVAFLTLPGLLGPTPGARIRRPTTAPIAATATGASSPAAFPDSTEARRSNG